MPRYYAEERGEPKAENHGQASFASRPEGLVSSRMVRRDLFKVQL